MAHLLPKTSAAFSSKDYWDSFFSQRQSAFEWYGEYHQLSPIFFKYSKSSDKILIIGCGNSTMSADLHKSGYTDLVSIDISDVVIKQMKKKYPKLDFRRMDAGQLEFGDGEFGGVIDKGTVDALLPDSSPETTQKVEKILTEVWRILKVGGRFICVSLLQEQVANVLLGFFRREQEATTWVVRVHRCVDAEGDSHQKLILPVYVVIATKMMRLPVGPCVFESLNDLEAKPMRYPTLQPLLEEIRDQQSYAFLRGHLSRSTLDQEYKTELYSADGNPNPKYELYIVDTPGADRKTGLKFVCFVVPEGRESEWLFGTPEGRKLSAKQCQAQRVVFVHLSRGFSYESTDHIKDELAGVISQLAPRNFQDGAKIPFLSVGEAAGTRRTLQEGHSPLSGAFIVEDVNVGEEVYRRLIFLDRPSVIQTEMRVHKNKLDYAYLSSEYYKYMVAGLGFFEGDSDRLGLLLGLGGGTLASYVAKYAKWKVQAVELDQAILDVARKHFGLEAAVQAHCGDALEFVKSCKDRFDVIWLDVDSKDISQALTCPPETFLKEEFLQNVQSLLKADGVFVLNLACRDEAKCKEVYASLSRAFGHVKVAIVPEDINRVLYASEGNCLECNVKKVRSLLKRSNVENDIQDLENSLQKILL